MLQLTGSLIEAWHDTRRLVSQVHTSRIVNLYNLFMRCAPVLQILSFSGLQWVYACSLTRQARQKTYPSHLTWSNRVSTTEAVQLQLSHSTRMNAMGFSLIALMY
jgi:hypothetical protein